MHAMTKAACIYNPTSDRGRAQHAVQQLKLWMQQNLQDHAVVWSSTSKAGHAEQLAVDFANAGVERIIAIGGDGTAHEVINGIMALPADHRPIIGVVPLGSGNDLAFACGLPSKANDALKIAIEESADAIDVAHIKSDEGQSRWFVNSAGLLFDGAVNHESHQIRRIKGFAMYLTAVLRSMVKHYYANQVSIQLDGQDVNASSHELLLLAIANGPREGGGFLIAPEASNQDGAVDVVSLEMVSRFTAMRLLMKVMKGGHVGHKKVRTEQARTVQITIDRPTAVHLDGEPWLSLDNGARQFEISVDSGALQVAGRSNSDAHR